MLAAVLFALSITLPNLILMGLGFFMRKTKQVSDEFVHQGSFLVFNYCLPCLLFFSVLDSKVEIAEQKILILAGIVTTFILFFLAELYAYKYVKEAQDKGVFVQGVFRSNMAIIALATVQNAYGDYGLGVGAVYMGLVTILFNVLAVITLSKSNTAMQSLSVSNKIQMIVKKICTNPLIIALLAAFVFKIMALPMPHPILYKVGGLLAAVALPLALICAGASIDIKSMLHPSGLSMQASLARIFLAPIIAVCIGWCFGLTKLESHVPMGVLFLMVSAPTAAASFVMAKAMGGNAQLAANILAFTTVFSMIGMGIGAAILRILGWM